jgi:hypothetical protein
VLGIGALVYFKLRARTQSAAAPDATAIAATTVAASAAADSSPAPPPTGTAAAAAPAAAPTPTVATTAAPAVAAATPSPTAAQPATPAAAARGASGGKEEPGFLTIVCSPNCDDVLDRGRSLGPSPIVHLSVPPGSHVITLKKGRDSKVVSVVVVSGQVSAQKIAMK